MQPHQEQVVAEKRDLDDKISRLFTFIHANEQFSNLSQDEKFRLHQQHAAMKLYSDILGERISASFR